MEEVKTLNCHPDKQSETIEFYQNFGWTLFNIQEIRENSNYLKREGDDLYQVRERSVTVKLTFKRYTEMQNYSKLKALESEYFETQKGIKKFVDDKTPNLFLVILPLLLGGLISTLAENNKVVFLIGYVSFLFLVFLRLKNDRINENEKKKAALKNAERVSNLERIMQQAKVLCV